MKLTGRVGGHFVTLIEVGMHQIECSPGHVSVARNLRSNHDMDKTLTHLDSVRCAHD